MKRKITLATATAMGLLMGAAHANDGNSAYTAQDGSNNSILIQQGAGPGDNDVGLDGAPILQKGDGNAFSETQSTGGGFSRGNNDITAGEQRGNSNSFGSNYSNNAGGNLIGNFLQYGNGNNASIGRNASVDGVITTIVQGAESGAATGGNGNFLSISQSGGSGNIIGTVKQIGSSNGNSMVNRHNRGTQITQSGSGNRVVEATIEGSNNIAAHPSSLAAPIPNPGGYATLDIRQLGSSNGSSFATARMVGSGGNQIVIDQVGDSNQFSVLQGDVITDTGNAARLVQTGSFNEAQIEQSGSFNTAVLTFTGDSNGLISLGGVAGTLVSGSGGQLVGGKALQDSSGALSGNALTYTVVGNSNKFAFAQIGGGNTITGQVGNLGSSDGNQVAVLQSGSSNTSSFTQNGGSNNLAVSQ